MTSSLQPSDIDQWAAALTHAWRQRVPRPVRAHAFPQLTLDDAYRVQ